MIDVALLSVIRRWHFREGMPIREITRRTGLSRNTVRKYLASGVVEPRYAQRKSPTKLDDYELTLTSWLFRESRRHRKQRKTVRQLHSDLVQLGYTGSYDRVAAFARAWRAEQQEAKKTASRNTFVPLCFAPGEAFQFDWSEDYAMIGGRNTKLQIAHFKLSHSRAFFLRAYLLQTHEMLFDAHYHAFVAFGGVPERGIYDNMKTAVDKVRRGKSRQVNQRFKAMVSHYLFEAEFCNPASGWEKGQIEKNVRDARHRIWQQAPAFASLAELNAWLKQRCLTLWQELPHPEDRRRTIEDYWQAEREHLMAVPSAFDGFVECNKRVSSTCLITHEQNRYSVPASFANRPVSLRVYPNGWSWSPRPRSSRYTSGSLPATTARVARRSTTGVITCRWCSASPGHCATVPRSRSCRKRSGSYRPGCCSDPAATGRWSMCWRWCCCTTSRWSNRPLPRPCGSIGRPSST